MRRAGLILAAFVAMLATALAAMVRFTGPQPAKGVALERAASARKDTGGQADDGLIVPVAGVRRAALTDSWGDARGEDRRHAGIDIMAPGGTPVLAAADGTVEKLLQSRLGGIVLYQRSRDRRWSYYYAHLAAYAPGIAEGIAVRRGDRIGLVGDTGNAGRGNYHLHFGIARMAPADGWWQGRPVNPYPLLAQARGAR